mmetsp:Transcript_18240/g.18307  ORF Transcript_18240/g.18307 Transcript_18240/m.18307 type:complete len:277 (+) Transcript_18240:118-948(+)
MNPLNDLSEENEEQVRKYIRFFRQKKDGMIRSITSEIDDAKQDRLNEDMFTVDDMSDFSDHITSLVKNQLVSEISDIINMNALIISKILENAQSQGAQIELDIGGAENHALLQAVEKMTLDAVPRTRKPGKIETLPSFKDEAKAMKEEVDRVMSSNHVLQERFSSVQNDATKLAKENAALKNEVTGLTRKVNELSGNRAESKSERESSNAQIERLEDELERYRQESAKRISESPQFQQMRDLMKRQNDKMKQLRRKLQRYEPEENSKEDDDDDEDI